MGIIGKILGGGGITAIGGAVREVAEVFTPSDTKQLELSAHAQMAALNEMGAEFTSAGSTWFDSLVNGLNRLPRPFLALGTVGLFVFAMANPAAFAARMAGLNAVPEPLWWLLGAVVAFYFGARETHYFRAARSNLPQPSAASAPRTQMPNDNPALQDWARG